MGHVQSTAHMIGVIHAHPFANGMRAIVLDQDPEQVDLLRKFGYKAFYGDATLLDLLRAAGAGREELREFFMRDRAQFETKQRKGWKAES